MPRVFDPIQFVLIALAGWMNQRQVQMIEYLREENRVLREQLGRQTRVFCRLPEHASVELRHRNRSDPFPVAISRRHRNRNISARTAPQGTTLTSREPLY